MATPYYIIYSASRIKKEQIYFIGYTYTQYIWTDEISKFVRDNPVGTTRCEVVVCFDNTPDNNLLARGWSARLARGTSRIRTCAHDRLVYRFDSLHVINYFTRVHAPSSRDERMMARDKGCHLWHDLLHNVGRNRYRRLMPIYVERHVSVTAIKTQPRETKHEIISTYPQMPVFRKLIHHKTNVFFFFF